MPAMAEAAGGAKQKLTYQDYCAIPEDLARHEILDGEHVVSPSPLDRHQRVLMNLLAKLRTHLEPAGLGEVKCAPSDVLLGEHTFVQPDLYVVLAAHFGRIRANGCHGPPDLVVEILSPSNRAYDQVRKRRVYQAAGVPEYWVVDPEAERVEVYRRATPDAGFSRPLVIEAPHDEAVTTPLVPDLVLGLAEVFDPGPAARAAAVGSATGQGPGSGDP